ncbi:MAG: hypothetical protein M3Y60_08680 [Bacteroidota bacterium]|nr:hypothetical protein [Bacteroidota bacterium]
MDIFEVEVSLWGKWKRDDTGEVYSFSPGPYPDKKFQDLQEAILQTPDNRAYLVGFNVFEQDEKAMLQIVNNVYEIRQMSTQSMVLIDGIGKEIFFTPEKKD